MIVKLYTDGACSPNPGMGGWAALFQLNDKLYTRFGYEADTTNNRMELLAIIKGLELLADQNIQASCVEIYSDSQYVVNTVNKNWRKNKNIDLWEILDAWIEVNPLKFIWVKGHASNFYNNRCDELAVKARTESILDKVEVSGT